MVSTAPAAVAKIVVWLALGSIASPCLARPAAPPAAPDAAQAVIDETCRRCHNDRARYGNLSLDPFGVARAGDDRPLAEKIIRKVRTGLMPPAGAARPAEVDLQVLAGTLETLVDGAAADRLLPTRRTFQRLNRAEYERSVRDLLAVDVRASDYLPLDTKSAGFDNIADVQLLSPTLMNGYLGAAAEISRLAVGDPTAGPRESTYKVTRWVSQREQVEGAPYGSRGGISVVHTFPADADYRFRVSFHHETTGELFGSGRGALHTTEHPEQIEVSIDGERVALLDIDRWMHVSDPDGVNLRTDPIRVTAGPHRGVGRLRPPPRGPRAGPHLAPRMVAGEHERRQRLRVHQPAPPPGPRDPGAARSRRRIRHAEPAAHLHVPGPPRLATRPACAGEILDRLGTAAYRRPLTDDDRGALVALYESGAGRGRVRGGRPDGARGHSRQPPLRVPVRGPAGRRPTRRTASPSRTMPWRPALSFFLWAAGPDAELVDLATAGRLSDPAVLDAQVRRMLADPRSEGPRHAVRPPSGSGCPISRRCIRTFRTYPDFDEQLKHAMRRETELFFHHLVREDRSLLELLTADYTFVNERLARHYRLPEVVGERHRRVRWPARQPRRGLLEHGSVLALTSYADRTSPVLRGKWVMEVLLGSPPPPPPPRTCRTSTTPRPPTAAGCCRCGNAWSSTGEAPPAARATG